MNIEYEATFPNTNKEEIRKILKQKNAKLIKKEFLQKRSVFYLPKGHEKKGAWVRVRDENDKITMSVKQTKNGNIEGQKEIELTVNNFQDAINLLKFLGCEEKAYQETKRELWELNNTKVTIDTWPFLEPFIEIEGESENAVKETTKILELDYNHAEFCAIGKLYADTYNITEEQVNDKTPRIVFGEKNPFIN